MDSICSKSLYRIHFAQYYTVFVGVLYMLYSSYLTVSSQVIQPSELYSILVFYNIMHSNLQFDMLTWSCYRFGRMIE